MTCVNLTTELHGITDLAAARDWLRTVRAAIEATPAGSEIRLLVDHRSYRPATLDVHRLVRAVVPELRAVYDRSASRHIVACALVHDDAFKMSWLARSSNRADAGFFSDVEQAHRWLASAPHERPLALMSPQHRRNP